MIHDMESLKSQPDPKPQDWVIEGILRTDRSRPSLLAGLPDAGKSTLAHQAAIAVANGTPFLDRTTQQGHVLLWKSDDSLSDIKADLFRAGATTESLLSVVTADEGRTNQEQLLEALHQHPETRLVIIETLGDFFPNVNLNKGEEMKPVLSQFRRGVMAKYPKAAYLLLVHFAKSNTEGLALTKVFGSTIISAESDARIYLEQVSDDDQRRIIQVDIRRGKKIPRTYLAFHEETQTSTLGNTVFEETYQKKQETRAKKEEDFVERVEANLREEPGIHKADFLKKMGGRAEVTKSKTDTLIDTGLIRAEKSSKKGNAIRLYWAGEDRPQWDASKSGIESLREVMA